LNAVKAFLKAMPVLGEVVRVLIDAIKASVEALRLMQRP
jgi:hypothetical protein